MNTSHKPNLTPALLKMRKFRDKKIIFEGLRIKFCGLSILNILLFQNFNLMIKYGYY